MKAPVFCDLCNDETNFYVVLEDVQDNEKVTDKTFEIVMCKTCGHCFLWPFPGDITEIENFYPKNYYAHNPPGLKRGIKFRIKRALRDFYYAEDARKYLFGFFLNKFVNDPPPIRNGKLCDIGCGNGDYIEEMQKYGYEVYGVEPNKTAVDYCRSKGLNVVQGYAEHLPYEELKFDVVRMWNVLEHTISPQKALFESNRILKMGGYLLLYVPNFDSIDRKVFGRYWGNLEVPRHLHHFRYVTLKLYLELTGFRIEKILYPGLILSGTGRTVKILKENRIGWFTILSKILKIIFAKIYYRVFKGSYALDAGIVVLAKKVKEYNEVKIDND